MHDAENVEMGIIFMNFNWIKQIKKADRTTHCDDVDTDLIISCLTSDWINLKHNTNHQLYEIGDISIIA